MPDHLCHLLSTENAKFPLGQTVITRNALSTLPPHEVLRALERYIRGDWGDLDPEDWEENERSLREGNRLFARYHTEAGIPFYIITEHDRSVTTVLLPEDY